MPVQRKPQTPPDTNQRPAFSGLRVTVHEAWGDDHVENLERRLLGAERDPNNHDYIVSTEELCRVLALSDYPFGEATRRRLEAIGAKKAPHAPTGPKPRMPAQAIVQDITTLNYHDRCRAYFEELKLLGGKAALAEAALHLGIEIPPASPAALTYEMIRRRHYPAISRGSVANIITKIRQRYP